MHARRRRRAPLIDAVTFKSCDFVGASYVIGPYFMDKRLAMCGTTQHRSWTAESQRKKEGDFQEAKTLLQPPTVVVDDCSIAFSFAAVLFTPPVFRRQDHLSVHM